MTASHKVAWLRGLCHGTRISTPSESYGADRLGVDGGRNTWCEVVGRPVGARSYPGVSLIDGAARHGELS